MQQLPTLKVTTMTKTVETEASEAWIDENNNSPHVVVFTCDKCDTRHLIKQPQPNCTYDVHCGPCETVYEVELALNEINVPQDE